MSHQKSMKKYRENSSSSLTGIKALSKQSRERLEAYQHLFYLLQVRGLIVLNRVLIGSFEVLKVHKVGRATKYKDLQLISTFYKLEATVLRLKYATCFDIDKQSA